MGSAFVTPGGHVLVILVDVNGFFSSIQLKETWIEINP